MAPQNALSTAFDGVDGSPATGDPPDMSPDQPFQSDEEMQAHVEGMYATEGAERDWSNEAEVALQVAVTDAIRSAPGTTRVTEVQCRTTLCKLRFEHDSSAVRDWLARELPQQIPWRAAMFSPPPITLDGVARSTVYISREGYPIAGIAE